MLGGGAADVHEFFLEGLVSGLELQGCLEMGDSGRLVSLRQLETRECDVRFGVGRVDAKRGFQFRRGAWGLLLRIGFAECAVDLADVWICLLQSQQLGYAGAGVASLDQGRGVGELEARSFACCTVEGLQCLARCCVVFDGELA